MKEWLFPTSYDHLAAEASHLVYHADANKVIVMQNVVWPKRDPYRIVYLSHGHETLSME